MLYTVFPICWYMDCYLILFQDLLISKKIHYKALRCLQVTFDSVEYTRKVCFTTVSKVVTSLQSTPDVALHQRVFGTCCYKESMHCSKSSPYTFLYANQKLSITRCQFFTWQIEWGAFQRGRKTRLFLVELSFTRVFESNFSRISEEVPTKKLNKIWSSFP